MLEFEMLGHARVLIVEDEAMIALSLAAIVEDADGCVAGWCETLREASAMLDVGPAPQIAIPRLSPPGR